MTGPTRHDRARKVVFVLVAALAVTSCGDGGEAVPSEPAPSGVADRPSSPAAPPPSLRAEGVRIASEAVDFKDALRPLRLAMGSRTSYEGPDGRLVLDVLEGDFVRATLLILDAKDRPVRGLRPKITPEGDSRVIDAPPFSDELGQYRFALMGGTMGEEEVQISAGDAVGSLILNVISQRAAGYGWLADIEGILGWDLLLEAEVVWGEEELTSKFPEAIRAKDGQTVKLAGFLMPLEAARMQRHFVLTSNPPSCFFHVPGGPAGAIEVFAKEPIEAGWDPILLEGRFEAVPASEDGVVYRLHEARALPLEPPEPAS